MFSQYWGSLVHSWPVGIDTDEWQPATREKDIDVIVYDKVLWNRRDKGSKFLSAVTGFLGARGRSYVVLRYGAYREEQFKELLGRSKSMIFLCEHETQGIAYQQALSCGVPIVAWDEGGAWKDPNYFPRRVCFEPVSSVPYFDSRCGEKFARIDEFNDCWSEFWGKLSNGLYNPRDYVLENLTLSKCAMDYIEHSINCGD
jgi:glycosyltransferase involved in cell wall biosynthesis